jgi:hypothetical protein
LGLFRKEPMTRWRIWLSSGQDYTIMGRFDPSAAAEQEWVTAEDGTKIRNSAIVAMKAL